MPSDSSEERDEPRKRRRRGPRRGGDRTRGDEDNADLAPGAPEETPESGGFGAGLG